MISPHVAAIVEMLETFSGRGLREPERFPVLLQLAHDRNKTSALGDLAFKGASVTLLATTLGKQPPDGEYVSKLEAELSEAVHDFHACVRDFVSDADPGLRGEIDRHVLAVSESALRHLAALAADFALLKEFERVMNDRQRDGGNASDGIEEIA